MWSDEFNAPDGSVVDASKWKIEEGGNGWGNDELEYYTSRPENLQIKNGNLAITAIEERYTGRVRDIHDRKRCRLVGLVSEGHRAQADLTNLKARAPHLLDLHSSKLLLLRGRRIRGDRRVYVYLHINGYYR